MRYEDSAERRPSDLGAVRAGWLRRRGMIEAPPRKSSICSMRVGKRECKNNVWNISKIWMGEAWRLSVRIDTT